MDGGKVMISWLSSDPDNGTTADSAKYLSRMEVYTAVIDPARGTVTEETRLTNDEYYDYTPTCVYDENSGDRIVYYVKTASTGTAEEMVNSYTNDCVIVYMLYSQEKGKWLFDYYYDNEVETEEERQTLLEKWNGQRFLSSPIPELGFDVPNISDFTAITYNGISVYAYTIDQDSSNDTAFDKELFVQCYDFATHTTYVPIRLTKDSVSDALPQFVRIGSGESADTKLFWYRNERDVAYIDISSLIREGVDDDGSIRSSYLTSPDGEKQDLDSLYAYVSTAVDNPQGSRSMADFKAVTDGDDIYIVWTQPVSSEETDADGNYKQCREVYAAALIQDENAPNAPNEPVGVEIGSNESDPDENGSSWSDPYRLTYTNAFTDEPNAVIDRDGNLIVLYNSYNQSITSDARNPVDITDFKLRASYMEPCGAVNVTDITFSDETPLPGETVEVSVDVKNIGLTYADGYTVNVYEKKDGVQGRLVKTIAASGKLLPGNTNGHSFEWTAPDSVAGVSLYAEAQEGGMKNVSVFESAKLASKAVYTAHDLNVYQDDSGYHLDCVVTNTGNAVSTADDTLNVIFSGPYAMAVNYTLEECDFAKFPLEGIGVNESKALTLDLKVIPKAFDEYGYLDCLVIVTDKNDKYLTDGEDIRLVASKPIELLLNGKPFPEHIELSVGETMEFAVSCEPQLLRDGMNASFGTDDTSIAVFDGTTLKALSAGMTVIHGAVTPYGTVTPEITVTVKGTASTSPDRYPSSGSESGSGAVHDTASRPAGSGSGSASTPEPESTPEQAPGQTETSIPTVDISRFTDVKASDWFYNSVVYTVGKGYFAGTSATAFEPYTNVTRGMLVTVLGRLDGMTETDTVTEYTDVDSHMYYASHIAWAAANGIVSGYGNNRFGPNDEVTREQMAKMIANFLTYKTGITASGSALDYIDADEIADWAKESVGLATQQGILSGNGHGSFAPQNRATRAEIAVVIEKLDKLLANQE